MHLPSEDKYYETKNEMIDSIIVLLGGRAAEKIKLDDISTGASNDIQRATTLARNMIALYGMSEELGLMAPATVATQYLESQSYLDCSQETSALVDRETKRLLQSCYEDAVKTLTENRELLDEISQYLLVKETITGDELMQYVNAENK